ncbi:MAG: Asp23/Gls24 family envelope stress response protein, partial [Mycobacteriaceae bacterium]
PAPTAASGAIDDPGQRGALVVRDRVVVSIATHAALEVPGVSRHASGLDRVTGRDLPRVQVHVRGTRVRAELDIAVEWPRPLAEVAAAVRSHVIDRLDALSGLQVDVVDVRVPTVTTAHDTDDDVPRRRVQ